MRARRAFLPHICPCEKAHFFFSGNTVLFHPRIGSSYRQKGKSLSRSLASPSTPPSLSCQEMLQTPNTFILGHAAGKSHAWIPALLLKEGPFLLCKASRNARERKADLLKSAQRAGGWEGEKGQPSARRMADFHTTSALPLGHPPGGGDGLTQLLGQLLIPLGFT